jgi:L-amino acid N-acyltransferase YncA
VTQTQKNVRANKVTAPEQPVNTCDLNSHGRTYPFEKTAGDVSVTFRLMKSSDFDSIIEFAAALPESDIAYLRMDITKPEVIEEWLENLRKKRTMTVLAVADGKLIGYASVHHNEMLWTRHLGEIRLLLHTQWRDSLELREWLSTEIFHVAKDLGVKRVFVQIPTDRPHLSGVYERMGFKPEGPFDRLDHDQRWPNA